MLVWNRFFPLSARTNNAMGSWYQYVRDCCLGGLCNLEVNKWCVFVLRVRFWNARLNTRLRKLKNLLELGLSLANYKFKKLENCNVLFRIIVSKLLNQKIEKARLSRSATHSAVHSSPQRIYTLLTVQVSDYITRKISITTCN